MLEKIYEKRNPNGLYYGEMSNGVFRKKIYTDGEVEFKRFGDEELRPIFNVNNATWTMIVTGSNEVDANITVYTEKDPGELNIPTPTIMECGNSIAIYMKISDHEKYSVAYKCHMHI